MKGLNVKKIAALGFGAALIGTALAPMVTAASLSDLSKDNFISSTGAPAVDVVVGSKAQVSDVIWAGNIASRIAQLATKPASAAAACNGGSPSNQTVDLTVNGGSTIVSGSGYVAESDFNWSNQETNFSSFTSSSSNMNSLINTSGWQIKQDSTSYTNISVQETLMGSADVVFQGSNGSNYVAPGDVLAKLSAGTGVIYKVDLGSGIELINGTNLDNNSKYDLKIPFLGKTYQIVEMGTSPKKIVMYAQTDSQTVYLDEEIAVTPTAMYAGSVMKIVLKDMTVTANYGVYRAKWALLKDGVELRTIERGSDTTYNLKSEFGSSYFSDDIYIVSAGKSEASSKYYASIRSGSSRVELRDTKGYPYDDADSTATNNRAWKASFNVDNNYLKSISLVNNWDYLNTSGSESTKSKYALQVGQSIVYPNNFAKLEFLGFEENPTTDVTIGDGKIVYSDRQNGVVTVPFMVDFSLPANEVVSQDIVSGKPYTFYYNTDGNRLAYVEGDKSSLEVANITWDANIAFTAGSVYQNAVLADIGARSSSNTDINTTFAVWRSNASGSNRALLLLQNQSFNIYNKAKDSGSTKLDFNGTYVGAYSSTSDANMVRYFAPSVEYFTPLAVITPDVNYTMTYNSSLNRPAKLVYTDNKGQDTNLFIRATDNASVWDYESQKNTSGVYGPSVDAASVTGGWEIKNNTNNILEAYAVDGTRIVSDVSKFTLTVPDETRQLKIFLGSDSNSVVSNPDSPFNGLAAGETKTANGIKVTINSITGSCGGSDVNVAAVEIVKAGNLIATDSSSKGKSIIVGGWAVNKAAETITVDSKNLQELLTADGSKVAAVADNGSIIVAGYSAADTESAAKELINVLDALIK
ncbi:MAG: S-layer protein [Candidatus ainarchaeum sp.]|nr:S-layer protein [Candidatus ainarchaeum sp.]